MHRQFSAENPDVTVRYWLYNDIFNHDFNISFGFPRSDICDLCARQMAQIRAAEASLDMAKAEELKVEHKLHIRKADVFNTQIIEATDNARRDGDTGVLVMDFEKNLTLPLTVVGQEYYRR